mmetsp:Transcript_18150/g.46466  ORF Transcript_18150/g.46466 Transcript_18150/m.46466 type:complete len:205 (-) Transcript_18150:196-810(-)
MAGQTIMRPKTVRSVGPQSMVLRSGIVARLPPTISMFTGTAALPNRIRALNTNSKGLFQSDPSVSTSSSRPPGIKPIIIASTVAMTGGTSRVFSTSRRMTMILKQQEGFSLASGTASGKLASTGFASIPPGIDIPRVWKGSKLNPGPGLPCSSTMVTATVSTAVENSTRSAKDRAGRVMMENPSGAAVGALVRSQLAMPHWRRG